MDKAVFHVIFKNNALIGIPMAQLYIPKRIKVGYQKRDDTYTKRLAYVIYYDQKGVLRKETSWQSWRHKDIQPEEFDNKPQDGFVLNKNIERYNWDHYGSGRSYIRIYDPRGIEFEVTPENLIGILMHTTCSKRGLEGEFVYAWSGKELILLPTSSEEYQKAQTYTELQHKAISLRDLVPGCSYTTKRETEVVYMGRFMWYPYDSSKASLRRKGKKQHIFWNGSNFEPKSSGAFLAVQNSTESVMNYAELMDNFQALPESSAIVGFEETPAEVILETKTQRDDYYCPCMIKSRYYLTEGNTIKVMQVEPKFTKEHAGDRKYIWCLNGFRLLHLYTINKTNFSVVATEGNSYRRSYAYSYGYDDGYDRYRPPVVNAEQILQNLEGACDVKAVLENGSKVPLDTFHYNY